MFKQIFCTSSLLLILSVAVQAQLPARGSIFHEDDTQRPSAPRLGSPEKEIMDRAVIRREEEEHKENVGRAKEAAQLGADLLSTFQRYGALSREDLKKLERMEKLSRKIRGAAGGSDDDEALKDIPRELGDALKRLAELSEELRKGVEKTSRHVISAAVISRSNDIIELVRHIRTFQQ